MNRDHFEKLTAGIKAWNRFVEQEAAKNPSFRANLRCAELTGAELRYTELTGADLARANLRSADLMGANLAGANLRYANLRGANLTGANLKHADLTATDLGRATLRKTDLSYADLPRADLRDADLVRADLTGAMLYGTDLRGVFLSDVRYEKLGPCQGIRLDNCYGSTRFIRDAKDNEYIEEFSQHHPFLYRIWSISSDCGRSILRWVLWSLFFALCFGYIFFHMGQENFSVKDPLPFDALTMMYYSVVTFTTLGFGDITPKTHLGAFVVTIEVIIGYVMLGGLISIMATKLARRAS